MYMVDGKPVQPDYGRKNPGISRLEFENLKANIAALKAEIDGLKLPASVDADVAALKAEAEALGIEVKGNCGANRITKAIEDAKASKVD